jgi:NodT family efflux transporter outer membrane factor (OMF) lipoprotein
LCGRSRLHARGSPHPEKLQGEGWKVATPSDQLPRGEWWAFYRDPKLDFLIKQVEISNQTVAAQAAAYEQARALIREAQAALFPTLNAAYSASRSFAGANVSPTGAPTYASTFMPQLSGTWDLDVWGQVRRQIESNASAAQASSATLDNAKLSAQAMLATAYFNLSATDSLLDLLERTAVQYRKTLVICRTNSRPAMDHRSRLRPRNVATARANLEIAEAQAKSVAATRAQYEHAIAMLIGRPPAELTIGRHLLFGTIPKIPITVPSALLERRPDIAAAERTMQQENALIGVAVAAYFPQHRKPPAAVQRRQRNVVARRGWHANSVQRRADLGTG